MPDKLDLDAIETACSAEDTYQASEYFAANAGRWVPELVKRVRELEACIPTVVRQGEMTMDEWRSKLEAFCAKLAQERDVAATQGANLEREACARLVENFDTSMARLGGGYHEEDRGLLKKGQAELAAAIRARK